MREFDSRAAWPRFRHLRVHLPGSIVLCVLAVAGPATFLAAPSPASAQEEGVTFIDPGSAPAKEYAVPLNAARALGDPREDVRSTGRAPAPASPESFGAGVEPPKQSADGQAKRKRKADGSPSVSTRSRAASDGMASVAPEDRAVAVASEMSSSLWAGAAALLLFLVAGAARRFQSSP